MSRAVKGYSIFLTPDDNGTLLATCVELPEVTTFGDNEASALRNVANAIDEAIAARQSDGEPVPTIPPHGPSVSSRP